MNELISRQKLIEKLERIKHDYCYEDCLRPYHVCHREDDCTLCALERIKEFIESQPPADNWIPCSERLPEEKENELYWTTHEDGSVIQHGYRKEHGFIYNWEVDDLEKRERQGDVIAWMPNTQPESYKGVE